jgi:hypothetical protein
MVTIAVASPLTAHQLESLTLQIDDAALLEGLLRKLETAVDSPQQLGAKTFGAIFGQGESAPKRVYHPAFAPYPAQEKAIKRALESEITIHHWATRYGQDGYAGGDRARTHDGRADHSCPPCGMGMIAVRHGDDRRAAWG